MIRLSIAILFILVLCACERKQVSENLENHRINADRTISQIVANAESIGIKTLFSVDHSRLAEKEGANLNASKVVFISDSKLNTALMKQNIRSGLDLPFRILSYSENDVIHFITTHSDFIKRRHAMNDSKEFDEFETRLSQLTGNIEGATSVSIPNVDNLEPNFGIIEFSSDFSFEDTTKALKTAIIGEGDTTWFGQIDYHLEAASLNDSLPKASLLIFGAPAPGAKAMHSYPTIRLDAFPQKVLVYEESDSHNTEIKIIYNDIPTLAILHFGESALPHKVIKFRLHQTLTEAVNKEL